MPDNHDISPNDIAIIGMALRVPGAGNVETFWQNLRAGREAIRTLSDDELLAAGESPERFNHPNYVRRTADLPDMEMFDAEFFGLSPKEAAIMDPQHRHFLECAWEAMEDAGRTPNTVAGPVGVFAGCGMGHYFYFNVCSNRQLVDQVGMFLLRHTGNDKDFLATRASFAFDLRGPSVNVQTACSTSLVAVHQACQSLLNGETDMALAGGVTIELPHRRGYMHQEGEILSPDGHCRAFDHRAGGTVFGSGAGVVILRRLADAIADGDIVHAVIKASAVNNDGASKAGYLAPSVTGQAEAIIEAHGLAGIEADTIQYVECHGTGTYLGDPIEIEAMTQAFRQTTSRTGFCRVGSVKSNIGHLDTAAGVVGLIKTTLALKHGEIPPTLGFEKPNPSIDFAGSPFIVNDRLTPWPQAAGPRRAAVNSLGVGGTNAHIVLEQAPLDTRAAANDAEPQVLLFSARSRKAAEQAAVRLGAALTAQPALSLADAAYTLHAGRKPFEHRCVVAAADRQDAIAVLGGAEPRRIFSHTVLDAPSGATFLFPGGGAQHVGMARRLYEQDHAFRAIVDEGLAALPADAASELRAVWFEDNQAGREDAARRFLRPALQLPAILIVEVAIARLWMARGVKPAALVGHSMGENAAACIAGVLEYRDAVRLVRLRGELFETIAPGGMLSVPLSQQNLAAILPAELDIASVNAPELCVVSGLNGDLAAFQQTLAARGVEATRIAIDIAAHSRMLDGILPRFEAFLRGIRLSAPAIPMLSNRTGAWLTAAEATDPLYWTQHLRSSVLFGRNMALLSEDPGRVYIEVGPGRALSSLAKMQPGIAANQVIHSLPHPEEETDDRLHFLTALGRVWAVGLPVDFEDGWSRQGARRVSLPTYPFQHQHYFIERAATERVAAAEEPLLRLPDMADWGYRQTWRQSAADILIDAGRKPQSWLLFLDDGGVGATLAAQLRELGHDVRTVTSGDGFAKLGRNDYVLGSADGRAGYDALVAGLLEDGPFPANIVHLWLVTHDSWHRPESSFFDRLQETGFYSLLHLAQAMADTSINGTHLTVVTNGMQRVGDEPLPLPGKATVLGPGLVIPKELPGVTVRLVDIDIPTAAEKKTRRTPASLLSQLSGAKRDAGPAPWLAPLWEELLASPGNEVVALRKGRRWVPTHVALPLQPAGEAPIFRDGGTYVITGGLGDLSMAIARALAGRHAAKLVLLGRTPLPSRDSWASYRRLHAGDDRASRGIAAIVELEALGADVLYLSADVGNPEEMADALALARKRFGAIHGVLHTAGVIDDALIPLKTFSGTENVLMPKVHGTAVLDQVLAGDALDFMVLFSSTSTDTAPAGQADYVAANAYLNAFAESRTAAGRRTIAVHWGIWNEVGLAARAAGNGTRPAETKHVAAHGPLFEHWVEDAGRTQWLEFVASPARHWMWNEHRLVSGLPVLPGTGYIELIAQALAEYGMTGTPVIEDLVFLRPLAIEDNAEKRVRVRLQAQDGGFKVIVAAGGTEEASVFHPHAEALVRIEADTRPYSVQTPGTRGEQWRKSLRAREGGALRSVQEDHIRFGPRWAVLRAIDMGERQAQASLSLDASFAADLATTRLHPGLLDIATGYAMELVDGYDPAKGLWAPMSYWRIRILDTLPQEITSHIRLSDKDSLGEGYAVFDVTITDPDGHVLVEIERFVVRKLASNTSLAEAGEPEHGKGEAATTPAMLRLAAQVRQGILPSEGYEVLARALATGETQPIVSTMPLERLKARAQQVQAEADEPVQFLERPEQAGDYVAPQSEIEKTLASYWSELLGIGRIGLHDNFFDIGGHSLIAVRLFRMIRSAYAVDLPISVLFEAPTIAACAALIEKETGGHSPREEGGENAGQTDPASRPMHLVPMSAGPKNGGAPFFLCAGMLGNVLNLRHLALLVGADRPIYGLQARGLYGEQAPHETFEEMARDYIAEIRQVQPHGPYLLGGFSGGGFVAYEMARQLQAAGETVADIVMLDTPVLTAIDFSLLDRVLLKAQDIRRERAGFIAQWQEGRRISRTLRNTQAHAADPAAAPGDFHNDAVRLAYMRALDRYEIHPYDGSVFLLKPQPNIIYRLPGGRLFQAGRSLVREDNGWSAYVADLTIAGAPGDHDSMVLNPNVCVLSNKIRARLKAREAGAYRYAMPLAAE